MKHNEFELTGTTTRELSGYKPTFYIGQSFPDLQASWEISIIPEEAAWLWPQLKVFAEQHLPQRSRGKTWEEVADYKEEPND